jgi:hypothetical protein
MKEPEEEFCVIPSPQSARLSNISMNDWKLEEFKVKFAFTLLIQFRSEVYKAWSIQSAST